MKKYFKFKDIVPNTSYQINLENCRLNIPFRLATLSEETERPRELVSCSYPLIVKKKYAVVIVWYSYNACVYVIKKEKQWKIKLRKFEQF
ncbi:MAG: hypothetical protein ABI723_05055 [Bacteroidia bacterium]